MPVRARLARSIWVSAVGIAYSLPVYLSGKFSPPQGLMESQSTSQFRVVLRRLMMLKPQTWLRSSTRLQHDSGSAIQASRNITDSQNRSKNCHDTYHFFNGLSL